MSQKSERRGIHVDQSELLCKKGCGYYGNAAWQGLCSKCWREEYQRARQKQIQEDWALAEKLQREEEAAYASIQGAQSHSQAQPSLAPFSKFEEKKTNEKTRKVTTVKKFFSPSSRTAPKKASSEKVEKVAGGRERHGEALLRDLRGMFTQPWEMVSPTEESHEGKTPSPSISRQSSIETDRVSRDFVDFLKNLQKPGREIHKQCRLFIEGMANKKDLGADELSECVQDFYQNMSDRLMTHFKGSTERVERVMDQVEKYIMTRLYKNVFCPETTDDEKKDLATQHRIRKHIFNAIKITKNEPASADDFLPTLIYIVLKANPPRLQSNIHVEDFERYMSGQASPRRQEAEAPWPQAGPCGGGGTGTSPCLTQVYQNLDLLAGLGARQERVLEGALTLESDLINWQESVEREVQEILEKFPLEIRPPASASAIDSDNVENDRLPPPLQPQ
ncbi:hypothetical protein JZ751_023121, partial [Albula glossodonta]